MLDSEEKLKYIIGIIVYIILSPTHYLYKTKSFIMCNVGQVTFNETLTFANVTPDFRLDVSLYCCRQSPAGGTSTLAKLTR